MDTSEEKRPNESLWSSAAADEKLSESAGYPQLDALEPGRPVIDNAAPASPGQIPAELQAGNLGAEGDTIAVPTGRRSSKANLAIAAALVLLTAVVLGVTLSANSGAPVPGAGESPTTFVLTAAWTTLAERSADLVLSGYVTEHGTKVPIQGTGELNLAAGMSEATETITSPGASVVEQKLFARGHFYLGLSENGKDLSSILGNGQNWVEIALPAGVSSGSLGADFNPIGELQVAEKQGDTVRRLGSSVVDGVPVSGFAITPGREVIEKNIQATVSANGLTAAQKQQLEASAKAIGAFTFDAWFDSSGLLRQEVVDLGGTGSEHVVVTVKNYGASVQISPPASSDVISYADFSKQVAARGAASK